MHTGLDVLGLDELVVVHAGEESFPMKERIRAVPLREVRQEVERRQTLFS